MNDDPTNDPKPEDDPSAEQETPAQQPPETDVEIAPESSANPKALLVGVGLLVVALIAAAGIAALFVGKSTPDKTTAAAESGTTAEIAEDERTPEETVKLYLKSFLGGELGEACGLFSEEMLAFYDRHELVCEEFLEFQRDLATGALATGEEAELSDAELDEAMEQLEAAEFTTLTESEDETTIKAAPTGEDPIVFSLVNSSGEWLIDDLDGGRKKAESLEAGDGASDGSDAPEGGASE